MDGETLAEMVCRHVVEGKAHIAKQHAIIFRLSERRLPTEAAVGLLSQFEDTLALHERHMDQIIQQQRSGERGVCGDLATPGAPPLT